jgi:GAF domain-containing protein
VEETRLLPDADEGSPWSAVEQLVRRLRASGDDSDELLARICREAVRLVPAARDVGVIITDAQHNLATVCATGPAPRELDELQMKLGTGPCLTAARKQIVVRMHDVAADTRWTEFRAAATSCDVASMLCVPLHVDDQMLGTLSLYGEKAGIFREGAEPVARMLGALAAVALAESQQRERMERALANRDLIGQAKGILMHRHGIRGDEAFEMLRAHSQRTNTKLIAVAERVVEAGALQ